MRPTVRVAALSALGVAAAAIGARPAGKTLYKVRNEIAGLPR
jgi:hypothetical protein